MVSVRGNRSSGLDPASSSAPPPCFAERHYPSLPDALSGGERDFGAEAVDRLSRLVSASLPLESRAEAVASDALMESLARHAPTADQRARRSLLAFVEALLDGNPDPFQAVLDEALTAAGDLRRVEATHLAPAARIVGDLWLADECDFLAVTIAVSRMECLYRRLVAQHRATVSADRARRILLALAPGNQHSFGLALVEERFRQSGWRVDCCGVGDGSEMLQRAAADAYDVIGVSVHSEAVVPVLSLLLAQLRRASCNRSAVLLGGGSLVIDDARLLVDAGFDCLAQDAASAVTQAEAALSPTAAAPGFCVAAE